MKTIFLLLAMAPLFQSQAFADTLFDSMAIFQKPNSVTILVNEKGRAKLNQIMLSFASEETNIAMWQSPNKDVKIQCSRGQATLPQNEAYSCTFRFLRSQNIETDAVKMSAQIKIEESSITTPIDLVFINRKQDVFKFSMNSTTLTAESNRTENH
ncbi:MAG: hypothetical protein H7222_07200 [Methylotenera sp.]|nr:hypothetical protein [Oligoflexia bacterium]